MRIRSLVAATLSAAVVLSIGASAVAAAKPTTLPAPVDYAYVRVLNAMTGQPALDVYETRVAADATPQFAGVKYGKWTKYQKAYFTPDCAGRETCQIWFEMAVPGETTSFKKDDLDLRAGNWYTVALASTGSTGPNFVLVRESMTKPRYSSIRFGNLTSDVTKNLDFTATRLTKSAEVLSSASAENVGYAQLSAIHPVTAGPYWIGFGVSGSAWMQMPYKNATLASKKRYTAYAIGTLGEGGTYGARFILVPNK
jgi:hypothetical protein